MSATLRDLVIGAALAAAVMACAARSQKPTAAPGMEREPGAAGAPAMAGDPRIDEISSRMKDIRGQRHEMGLRVDPSTDLIREAAGYDTHAAMCPDGEPEADACQDACTLARDICDNADSVCDLAGQLAGAPQHGWADEQCGSARASCKEARQKCCGCAADHPALRLRGLGPLRSG